METSKVLAQRPTFCVEKLGWLLAQLESVSARIQGKEMKTPEEEVVCDVFTSVDHIIIFTSASIVTHLWISKRKIVSLVCNG